MSEEEVEGAQVLVESLVQQGIQYMFGVGILWSHYLHHWYGHGT